MTAACELVEVRSSDQWSAFHRIRETVLFEARGRHGVYDRQHPDDFDPRNQPLLFVRRGVPIGVVRLDRLGHQRGGVRLVAIDGPSQRKGYGRALMTLVEQRAADAGLTILELNSAPEAVAFYQRVGWSLVDPNREHPLFEKACASPIPEEPAGILGISEFRGHNT